MTSSVSARANILASSGMDSHSITLVLLKEKRPKKKLHKEI
jgi:hypothetical protein